MQGLPSNCHFGTAQPEAGERVGFCSTFAIFAAKSDFFFSNTLDSRSTLDVLSCRNTLGREFVIGQAHAAVAS